MPKVKVGNKISNFPYTKGGIAEAQMAAKKPGAIMTIKKPQTSVGVKGVRKVTSAKVMPSKVSKKVNRFGISNLKIKSY